MLNEQQFHLFGQIQTSQPYSDTMVNVLWLASLDIDWNACLKCETLTK